MDHGQVNPLELVATTDLEPSTDPIANFISFQTFIVPILQHVAQNRGCPDRVADLPVELNKLWINFYATVDTKNPSMCPDLEAGVLRLIQEAAQCVNNAKLSQKPSVS